MRKDPKEESLAVDAFPGPTARQKLRTALKFISYDFELRAGIVVMPSYCNVDMMRCIQFFKSIDPDVEAIRTLSPTGKDLEFRKDKIGWEKHHPNPQDVA